MSGRDKILSILSRRQIDRDARIASDVAIFGNLQGLTFRTKKRHHHIGRSRCIDHVRPAFGHRKAKEVLFSGLVELMRRRARHAKLVDLCLRRHRAPGYITALATKALSCADNESFSVVPPEFAVHVSENAYSITEYGSNSVPWT